MAKANKLLAYAVLFAAVATTQHAVADTVSLADASSLTAANSQNIMTETWTAKLGGEGTITLDGLSNPFSEGGYALITSYDIDGTMTGIEGFFNRINGGPNPKWIELTGNQYDERGTITYTGISGSIGLLGVNTAITDADRAKWATITGANPAIDALLNTTSGEIMVDGGTLFYEPGATLDLSRPASMSTVPAPAAAYLFASGLPLLAGAARRKNKAKA